MPPYNSFFFFAKFVLVIPVLIHLYLLHVAPDIVRPALLPVLTLVGQLFAVSFIRALRSLYTLTNTYAQEIFAFRSWDDLEYTHSIPDSIPTERCQR